MWSPTGNCRSNAGTLVPDWQDIAASVFVGLLGEIDRLVHFARNCAAQHQQTLTTLGNVASPTRLLLTAGRVAIACLNDRLTFKTGQIFDLGQPCLGGLCVGINLLFRKAQAHSIERPAPEFRVELNQGCQDESTIVQSAAFGFRFASNGRGRLVRGTRVDVSHRAGLVVRATCHPCDRAERERVDVLKARISRLPGMRLVVRMLF